MLLIKLKPASPKTIREAGLPSSSFIFKNTHAAAYAAALFLAVSFFLFSPATASPSYAEELASITGTVEASELDEEGEVSAVVIWADDAEYLVNNDEKGAELLKLLNKEVIVRGVVSEDEEGDTMISVEEYEEIEDTDGSVDTEYPEEE